MYAAISCLRCNDRFTPRSGRQRYCSTACRFPEQTCPVCQAKFKTRNFRTQTCCSKRCSASQRDMAAVNALIKNRRGGRPAQRTCEQCGETYQPTSSRQKVCVVCSPNKSMRARLRRYGVTERRWRELESRFDGMCWICRERPVQTVDHCHETGRVRGALCRICNMALHYVERPDWWVAATAYLADQEVGDARSA